MQVLVLRSDAGVSFYFMWEVLTAKSHRLVSKGDYLRSMSGGIGRPQFCWLKFDNPDVPAMKRRALDPRSSCAADAGAELLARSAPRTMRW